MNIGEARPFTCELKAEKALPLFLIRNTINIMEDSTAKTIDFLRARLLAERSVSKTARQRACELEKRVTELEKQLKFVSLQRKKAEKAAADVLAILENHGKNDISEPIDSGSDEEEMSNDFMYDKRVETEGFSGSEVESSSVNGKDLSWKNSTNSSSHFHDKKYMDASRRRRNSFTSTGSSPRCVGKSCRQIRHREHRSGSDVSQNNDATNGNHENGGQTSSEGVQNSADVATETSLEKPNMCNGHAVQNNGTEREMEKALKHQAQFIARYEEEEKAQREWEDKFRENNGSTPENSLDPGTHSDVTEELEETKALSSSPSPPGATYKLISGSQPIDHGVVDPNISKKPITDPEPFPGHNMKNEPLDGQSQPPDLQGTPTNLSQASSSQGKPYASDLEPEKNPDKLGSVLEALQQAKLSLKQNLDKFPLLENGPSVPNYRSGEKFLVPFSSAGLFRLPTDYEYEGTTIRANSLTYDPSLSLTNYPTNDLSERQFISSPYRESFSRSTSSLDDRFRMVPTFPYQETMPEIPRLLPSVLNPRLDIHPSARDPRFDTGMDPPTLDPRLGVGSSVDPRLGVGSSVDPRLGVGSPIDPRFGMGSPVDPQLGMGPSAIDPRLGVGSSTLDPRLGVGSSMLEPRLGVGQTTLDPRLGVGSSMFEPRLGVGQTTLDPRLGVGSSMFESRLGVGQTATDPRLGVGQSAFDPRLGTGPPFMGDRHLHSSTRLPLSSRYATPPGDEIPLQTRSLYDDFRRPNTYTSKNA
ncbi:hypothetical protein L1987_42781 [Smallanthus sonchifolius]|uniref:Uncharacterized protein n=1 Tax=Smallanthus sonchifolius TaxID=185202 RepID=A0ACB9GKZ7_9ASTR|nr:hypothetical protein L1987_42781 [Smallanthus sonchifolius]